MTLEQMESLMESIGQPKYRAAQLFNWVYKRGILSFHEMTNFAKSLRQQLAGLAEIEHVSVEKQVTSTDEQTTKFLFKLADDLHVESVFMIDGKRRTVCLSSQVGCALGCSFCATGKMGFQRNLSAGEIVDQLLAIQSASNVEVTNIVIMGMGEPFLNYDEVIKACDIISHDKGIAIGKRKITISTSGIVPAIMRFADEVQRYKLAISLNAANDEIRTKLMPINKKYPLNELINAARYYAAKSRNRITFEYVMIDGLNDGIDDALRLSRLLKGLKCKINIIPYNSIDEQHAPPSEEAINEFIRPFLNQNIVISVRRSKGMDINAACGQLYYKYKKSN
ncbi:MAG: 23S rRNA (adenine(2503)-C(2))-methyltransferase RlmN [bacterium]|nr:MAG: 23S rRNA (adenine(2503)-C(2))-methyltransferase RlmN [bacterium]